MVDAVFAAIADPTVLLAAVTLTGIYLVCLIVGGGMLFISAVLGGDAETSLDTDVSVGGDVDIDVDADMDVDIDPSSAASRQPIFSLTQWFSMQFLIYGVASFGLVGTVLTYASDMETSMILIVSIVVGVVLGQAAHHLMMLIRRSGGNSAVQPSDYVNQLGRVTVAVQPPQTGQVAVQVRGVERFIPATSGDKDQSLAVGETVRVMAVRAGTAVVTIADNE